MTDSELQAIEARFPLAADAMHSGCTDYACYCHYEIPGLVAEIRRLQASLALAEATVLAHERLIEAQAKRLKDIQEVRNG